MIKMNSRMESLLAKIKDFKSVSYPDGYPDFKSAGMVEQEVNIGPFQGYNKDFPRVMN